jgi:beta-galactosidase
VPGPAEIVGETPVASTGGTGAVWLKARETPGAVRLTAKHPYLGARHVDITVKPAAAELL